MTAEQRTKAAVGAAVRESADRTSAPGSAVGAAVQEPAGGASAPGSAVGPRRRIRLTVAYDGTAYNGWQYQPNGVTIEETLNRALTELTGERIEVIGASRTDAGVHARCNYAVFDTRMRMEASRFSYALNQRLPEDIRVRRSEEVGADWHPRKCRSIKTYEYRILNEEFPDPLDRLYAHFTYLRLDVEKMREAAAYLVGEHDFRSFCSIHTQAESTVRRITALTVERNGSVIAIRISGNGFLYNMVRIIAGTLLEVGSGKYPPERVKEILEARDRRAAGPTAPARGLTLADYEFLTDEP